MLLMINHHDSFTYNLYQYFLELNEKVSIVNYDDLHTIQSFDDYSAVILSPGPGKPTDYPDSLAFLTKHQADLPILGVCLGHQMLAEFFGGQVIHSSEVKHGKQSPITHQSTKIFKNLPKEFKVGRYHSLMVKDIKKPLKEVAWTNDGIIMALEHETLPIMSVQFHPESVLTEHGHQILKNFLDYRRISC